MALFSSLSKDEDFKAEEKARRIQKLLDDRSKSVHERNLENFMERKRQEAIKKKMDQINQTQNNAALFGSFTPKKNIFLGHKYVLHADNKILGSKHKKEKGLFFK